MPSQRPSLKRCFEIYREALARGIDPLTEDEQQKAFYCGFEACMQVVDVIATIADQDEEEGFKAWDSLQAEYDKFATAHDCGELSTIH